VTVDPEVKLPSIGVGDSVEVKVKVGVPAPVDGVISPTLRELAVLDSVTRSVCVTLVGGDVYMARARLRVVFPRLAVQGHIGRVLEFEHVRSKQTVWAAIYPEFCLASVYLYPLNYVTNTKILAIPNHRSNMGRNLHARLRFATPGHSRSRSSRPWMRRFCVALPVARSHQIPRTVRVAKSHVKTYVTRLSNCQYYFLNMPSHHLYAALSSTSTWGS
jgi:hypothetical protein